MHPPCDIMKAKRERTNHFKYFHTVPVQADCRGGGSQILSIFFVFCFIRPAWQGGFCFVPFFFAGCQILSHTFYKKPPSTFFGRRFFAAVFCRIMIRPYQNLSRIILICSPYSPPAAQWCDRPSRVGAHPLCTSSNLVSRSSSPSGRGASVA